MKTMLALSCALTLALAAGCGDNASTSSDAAADAKSDSASDAAGELAADAALADGKWPGTCDPVLQNCDATQECIFKCPGKEFVCAAATGGTAKHGELCSGSPAKACEKGTSCTLTGGPMMEARCRKYCDSDSDCPTAPGTCDTAGLVCDTTDTVPIGRLCKLPPSGP